MTGLKTFYQILAKIVNKIVFFFSCLSNASFINYMKKRGIQIGEGTKFRPFSTEIDLTRPSLVSIGNDCYFNKNFVLLTHDWVTRVFIYSGRDFLPSSGKVSIGNNVSTGQNVTILKGVTIGDNVFIGANSLVTKDIPSNCIAAGTPCRVLMTLEDYYKRRQVECIEEALLYARSIKERFNREPIISDFKEEFCLFIDGTDIESYSKYRNFYKSQLGPSWNKYKKEHKSIFRGFDSFIKEALTRNIN